MKIIAIFLLLMVGCVFSQPAQVTSINTAGGRWQIPFASADNTISLSVQNSSSVEVKNVTVTFNNIPSWLSFQSNEFVIKSISANSSGDAEFTFSVDKKAPVGRDTTLTATITTSNGQSWTKDIKVSVGAPEGLQALQQLPEPVQPINEDRV